MFLCQQGHKLEYGIRHANKEVQRSLQSNSTTALLSKADGDWRAQLDFFLYSKDRRSVSMPAGFRRHLVGKTRRNVCYSDVTYICTVGRSVITWTFS